MSSVVSSVKSVVGSVLPHQGWLANPFRQGNDMFGLYPKQPATAQPGTEAPAAPDYSVATRAGGAAQAVSGSGYLGLGNAIGLLGKSTKRNTYATQDLLG